MPSVNFFLTEGNQRVFIATPLIRYMVSINLPKLSGMAIGLGLYGVIGSLLTLVEIGTTFDSAILYYGLSFVMASVIFVIGLVIYKHTSRWWFYGEATSRAGFIYGFILLADLALHLSPYTGQRVESFPLMLFAVYLFTLAGGIVFAHVGAQWSKAATEVHRLENSFD